MIRADGTSSPRNSSIPLLPKTEMNGSRPACCHPAVEAGADSELAPYSPPVTNKIGLSSVAAFAASAGTRTAGPWQ